jgi:hypothetical protein
MSMIESTRGRQPLDEGAAPAVTAEPRRTAAAGLRMVFGGRARTPVGVLGCDVLLAIDRPDLLELRLLDRAPRFTDGAEALPAPGTPLRVVLGDEEVFHGVVERVTLAAEADADAAVAIAACAPWQLLRRRRRRPPPARASLRELAWGVALDLGLEPPPECPDVPAGVAPAAGDPLAALARTAREHGLRLAVSSGRLHLGRGLPGPTRRHRVTPAAAITRLEVERRLGDPGEEREARLGLAGLALPRPLDAVALAGFGAERDAWYRVVRCHLALRRTGWETRLEMEHRS